MSGRQSRNHPPCPICHRWPVSHIPASVSSFSASCTPFDGYLYMLRSSAVRTACHCYAGLRARDCAASLRIWEAFSQIWESHRPEHTHSRISPPASSAGSVPGWHAVCLNKTCGSFQRERMNTEGLSVRIRGRMRERFRWLRQLFLARRELAGRKVRRGLVMIQIDGLSRPQLEKAAANRQMPFLKHLQDNEDYHLLSHYSGLPSSTPAVQGELFYGIHSAVPSFGFRDSRTGKLTSMFNFQSAAKVERDISQGRDALLEGGGSYANVLTGGAVRNRYCLSKAGGDGWLRSVSFPVLLRVFGLYVVVLFRIMLLAAVESGLAVVDFFRGVFERKSFFKELTFIPSRLGVCILIRELVKARMLVDISLGLPVIHGNFLGYDEQAHRRGPSSAFAHWTLKGIDHTVSVLWHAAKASRKREYDVWIYSDHGQEDVVPYSRVRKKDIAAAVAESARAIGLPAVTRKGTLAGMQSRRAQLIRSPSRRNAEIWHAADDQDVNVQATGLGPLCHVYFSSRMDAETRNRLAGALVEHAGVPIVMAADGQQGGIAWTRGGQFRLPEDIDSVVGSDHLFAGEIGYDMVRLLHHPAAGTLVLSGWRPDDKPLTFAAENGAHAGPGRHETHGFALIPAGIPRDDNGRLYLRPRELRFAALRLLGRYPLAIKHRPAALRSERGVMRMMTYNTHGCRGSDGVVRTDRIARVISRYDPDVVALQELDVGQERSAYADQAKEIAERLDMRFRYHPSYILREGSYGNAVLSRLPMELVRAGPLPGNGKSEPRGALWAEINNGRDAMQCIATHLSYYPSERHLQVNALLQDGWLNDPRCEGQVVLCGDFNMLPRSRSYRALCHRLRDALEMSGNGRVRTWMGLACLDYIFIGGDMIVRCVNVVQNHLTRLASDHYPVIVDIGV
ncbi:MAG: oxidoreductase [Chitinivibrionales bacterium]|nr:oxidoreductase [Chitinivibrionales bacterium]MBD3397433.1 oxidoreductase [Chitinivibrionales bacterium]